MTQPSGNADNENVDYVHHGVFDHTFGGLMLGRREQRSIMQLCLQDARRVLKEGPRNEHQTPLLHPKDVTGIAIAFFRYRIGRVPVDWEDVEEEEV